MQIITIGVSGLGRLRLQRSVFCRCDALWCAVVPVTLFAGSIVTNTAWGGRCSRPRVWVWVRVQRRRGTLPRQGTLRELCHCLVCVPLLSSATAPATTPARNHTCPVARTSSASTGGGTSNSLARDRHGSSARGSVCVFVSCSCQFSFSLGRHSQSRLTLGSSGEAS